MQATRQINSGVREPAAAAATAFWKYSRILADAKEKKERRTTARLGFLFFLLLRLVFFCCRRLLLFLMVLRKGPLVAIRERRSLSLLLFSSSSSSSKGKNRDYGIACRYQNRGVEKQLNSSSSAAVPEHLLVVANSISNCCIERSETCHRRSLMLRGYLGDGPSLGNTRYGQCETMARLHNLCNHNGLIELRENAVGES